MIDIVRDVLLTVLVWYATTEVCEECSVNWKPESETGNTSISNYIYVYHPQSDDREEQVRPLVLSIMG